MFHLIFRFCEITSRVIVLAVFASQFRIDYLLLGMNCPGVRTCSADTTGLKFTIPIPIIFVALLFRPIVLGIIGLLIAIYTYPLHLFREKNGLPDSEEISVPNCVQIFVSGFTLMFVSDNDAIVRSLATAHKNARSRRCEPGASDYVPSPDSAKSYEKSKRMVISGLAICSRGNTKPCCQ